METLTYSILIFLGLCLGSFAGATIWRLRARQLIEDKKAGYAVDTKELKALKPLSERTVSNDRSQCLSCSHVLAWYDLVPLVSWLQTRGKCRYCGNKIGSFEPTIEFVMATLFVLLFALWPMLIAGSMTILSVVLWYVSFVMLIMLFFYDLKWYLLPNVIVFPLIAISLCARLLVVLQQTNVTAAVMSTIGSVAILSGIYGVLYLYSKQRYGEENTWVGFGDVKLGVALGLLLGSWQLAFLSLFLANLLGVIILLPSLISKKVAMSSRIPLGPLLIAGFFITLFFGPAILTWYQSLTFFYPM